MKNILSNQLIEWNIRKTGEYRKLPRMLELFRINILKLRMMKNKEKPQPNHDIWERNKGSLCGSLINSTYLQFLHLYFCMARSKEQSS